jgi:hypothetical protein
LPDEVLLGVAFTAGKTNGLSQVWLYDPRYESNPEMIGPWEFAVVPGEADLGGPCSHTPGFKIRSIKTRITDGWDYDRMNELLDTGAVMGIPGYEQGERIDSVVNLRDIGDGAFGNDRSFPGIDPLEDPAAGDDDNYFATEILACIQLAAGGHIIGVNSDDGAIIEIGSVEVGRTAEWKEVSNVDFVFDVEADGYYWLRARTLDGDGPASIELHEVLGDGTRVLLGDVGAGGAPVFAPVEGPAYADIGLRVYDGTGVITIACEPEGAATSPLRIAKNGTTYGIALVEPSDVNACGIRIETSSGVKALRKLQLP